MAIKEKKTLLVIGTGTIGYELIRRLILAAAYSNHPYFSWEEIIIHKQTPLKENVARINHLFNLPYANRPLLKLCADPEKVEQFKLLGMSPHYTLPEALARADVVFDVTPFGLANRTKYYEQLSTENQDKVFVAQGSEYKKKKKFGKSRTR